MQVRVRRRRRLEPRHVHLTAVRRRRRALKVGERLRRFPDFQTERYKVFQRRARLFKQLFRSGKVLLFELLTRGVDEYGHVILLEHARDEFQLVIAIEFQVVLGVGARNLFDAFPMGKLTLRVSVDDCFRHEGTKRRRDV